MSIKNFDISKLGKNGIFAGIGSRNVNKLQTKEEMIIGMMMALSGYHMRSGRADGSDLAFEFGVLMAHKLLSKNIDLDINVLSNMMSIFLPWSGFNGKYVSPGYFYIECEKAKTLTSQYHKGWSYLSDAVKNLMARNAMQILGPNLDKKVNFVICSTKDKAFNASMTSSKTGGTGQAIRIADNYNVKVFNIEYPEHGKRLKEWCVNESLKFEISYGVNPIDFLENEIENFKGFENTVKGNLIESAMMGEVDILIHGLSCQNTQGSGFAKELFKAFPEAYEADQKTKKGDRKKLGTCDYVKVNRNGKEIIIVNAYTQVFYGRESSELYADYDAIRKVFEKVGKDFPGKKISFPKIGAGLANGCWITISNIINDKLRNNEKVYFDFNGMELKEILKEEFEYEQQIEMNF